MRELKGHEEAHGERRPQGVEHSLAKGRKSWKEIREAEAAELGTGRQPYVVVIGGGQGGIALGERAHRAVALHPPEAGQGDPGDLSLRGAAAAFDQDVRHVPGQPVGHLVPVGAQPRRADAELEEGTHLRHPAANWRAVVRRWERIDVFLSGAAVLAFALLLAGQLS